MARTVQELGWGQHRLGGNAADIDAGAPSTAHRPVALAAARFFRVLGDPTRLRILELLGEGDRTVGELIQNVGQPQPRVSTTSPAYATEVSSRTSAEVARWSTDWRIRGLRQLLEEAADSYAPLADRLATCSRIGPDWV